MKHFTFTSRFILLFGLFLVFAVSGWTIAPTLNYSCGIFPSVLTSYDSIVSGYKHPANNDQACYTGTISYPYGKMTGEITCDPNSCGGSTPCERMDPPANRLEYTWSPSTRLGMTESSPSGTLSNYEYGNFNGNFDLTLAPTTINTNGNPVMMLGDVTLTDNGNTLSLKAGDYFFNSLTFSKNNQSIVLPSGGDVRIFVQNNFSVAGTGLNVNLSGSQNDLFVYVAGNLDFYTNGNVEVLKGYFYVKKSVLLYPNSNNFKVYGGITAEGPIKISGNKGDFIQQGDPSALGYGGCNLCFQQPINDGTKVSTTIENLGKQNLRDLNISKAYAYSGYTPTAYTTTAGAGAGTTSSNINTTPFNTTYSNFSSTANGFVYTLGDFNTSKLNTITDTTTIDFNLDDYNLSTPANVKALYIANYDDEDNKHYNIVVDMCWDRGLIVVPSFQQAGLFDAWDTFRNVNDRNISTKIAGQTFYLTIASLNSADDALQLKGANRGASYRLFTDTNKTSYAYFDANASTTIQPNFTIASAEKNVSVQFKFCADYNGTAYDVKEDANCSTLCTPTYITDNAPCYREMLSSDIFAIRPNNFDSTITANQIFIAEQNSSVTFKANKYGGTNPTDDYNETNSSFAVDVNISDSNKSCTAPTLTLTPSVSFINGLVTNNYSLNNVGDFNVTIHEINGAEFASVDIDDTNDSTRLITPFATQIKVKPKEFLVEANLTNNGNGFTYLSNFEDYPLDRNVSALLKITLSAKGDNNTTLSNYTSLCYAKDGNITLTLNNEINGSDGNLTKLLWYKSPQNINGNIALPISTNFSLEMNATDFNTTPNGVATMQYLINFNRNKMLSLNPFIVNIHDINRTDTDSVSGHKTLDQNASFVYGRTHAPTYRFVGTEGDASIFYEIFCFGNGCDKTLLPNGTDSNSTDDPRWFTNTAHNPTTDGNVGTVTQKGATVVTTTNEINNTGETIAQLHYDGTRSYPYKTTMENNASDWLIYNKYDGSATSNEFGVEFIGKAADWSGIHETNNSTKSNGTLWTNKRLDW